MKDLIDGQPLAAMTGSNSTLTNALDGQPVQALTGSQSTLTHAIDGSPLSALDDSGNPHHSSPPAAAPTAAPNLTPYPGFQTPTLNMNNIAPAPQSGGAQGIPNPLQQVPAGGSGASSQQMQQPDFNSLIQQILASPS